MGGIYNVLGIPDSVIYYYEKSLVYRKEIKWEKGIAISISNIGQGYLLKGNLKEAMKHMLEAANIAEEIHDSLILASTYNNLGLVYKTSRDYDKALLYFTKAFEIKKRKTDPNNSVDIKSLATTILNLGMVHNFKGQDVISKSYYEDALGKFKSIDYLPGQAMCYNNLGVLYYNMKDYPAALKANLNSLEIKKALGDEMGMASSYINIGADYFIMNNVKKAKENHFKALELIEKNDLREERVILFEAISKDFEFEGDLKNALHYYKKFEAIKDTLLNSEKSEQMTEMQTKYDTEKKDKEIIQKNSELKEKGLEAKQKETQRNAFVAGFILVLVLMGFVFNSYKQKKKANIEISKQKEIIIQQKHVVEEKQKETLDSINYAKRIQYTLLAHEDLLTRHLPEHFVLFKPKDIVSGDFYWATSVRSSEFIDRSNNLQPNSELRTPNSELFYLAVCDSTGHGVPGAFMSLLNISFLNEAITERKILSPDKIFDYVRNRLIENINKDGQQDGFDGIIVCFDKVNNTITYAAAHNAPLIIREGYVVDCGYDKMPVGIGERKENFKLYNIHPQKGDMIYLFTDGYPDQFGGPNGKKFKYKQLESLLKENCTLSMEGQKSAVEQKFNEWKGSLEQIDDVLLIGIKV